jgi:hypothetical protein
MRLLALIKCLTLSIVGFTITACAANPQQDNRQSAASQSRRDQCVFFSSVYDWQALDDTNMVIWAPSRTTAYHLELSMPLPGLKFAHTVGFIDGTRDGQLCSFGFDAVTMGEDSIPQKSTIRSLTRLDAAGITQLEEKYKTKLARDPKRKTLPKEPDRSKAQ